MLFKPPKGKIPMPDTTICNVDRISDALDGLLDGNELDDLQNHLETCTACSEVYEELRLVSSCLQSLPTLTPSGDLLGEIRKAIRNQTVVERKKNSLFPSHWFDGFAIYPWRAVAFAGAMCFIIILYLWTSNEISVPQPYRVALELQSDEDVAGLDLVLALGHEGTILGTPVIPSALEGFLVASHSLGSNLNISMASAQSIGASSQIRILELPLTRKTDSESGADIIRILSVRAYRADGKPTHAEIRATPMLSTQDGKLNTTA
jgi:hypothetical protein